MSKHARTTLVLDLEQQAPKHSKGWSVHRQYLDAAGIAHTPGKHAKPFAKHHPATPITEATPANVTPLFPAATALDVAA